MFNSKNIISVTPEKKFLFTSPFEIYGNNCIVDGGFINGKIIDDYTIQVNISPITCILNNTLIILSQSYSLDLNLVQYIDSGKIVVLLHFIKCSKNEQPNVFFRLAYVSNPTFELYPPVYIDQINKTDIIDEYPTLVLGTFTFTKEPFSNKLSAFINSTPDQIIDNYLDFPKIKLGKLNNSYIIRPLDNITTKLAKFIKGHSGNTGATGSTGGTGKTGNTGLIGGTGSTGGTGKLNTDFAVKHYIHHQTKFASVWNINHNLNQLYLHIQVYDISHKIIIPNEIILIDNNNIQIDFNGQEIIGIVDIIGGIYKPDQKQIHYGYKESFIGNETLILTGGTGGTGGIGKRGLQGYQGPQGLPGIQGPPGTDGCDGKMGPEGVRGPDGARGQIGKAGCKGLPGDQGPQGPTGGTGNTGGVGGPCKFINIDQDKIDEFLEYMEILNTFPCQLFPIGSVYITFNEKLPTILLSCGKWELIENKFLYADANTSNLLGGEEKHKLLISEIPEHSHKIELANSGKHNHLTDLSVSSINDFLHDHSSSVLSNGKHTHEIECFNSNNHTHFVDCGESGKDLIGHIFKGASGNLDCLLSGDHIHDINIIDDNSSYHTHNTIIINNNVSHNHENINFSKSSITHDHEIIQNPVYESKEHNNMPPYITAYIWRRIE